jgi:hypothetical protein
MIQITRRTRYRWLVTVDRVQIATITQVGTVFCGYNYFGDLIAEAMSLDIIDRKMRRIYNEC